MVVPSGEATSRNISLIDDNLLRGPPRSRCAPTESPWNRRVGYATLVEMAPRSPPGQRPTLVAVSPRTLPQDERPDPLVAQEETAPHQHPEKGGEQEPRILHAHLGGHGAAEVARKHDRPDKGSTGDGVEGRAHEQGEADTEDGSLRVAELHRALHGGLQHHDLDARVEEQERDHERAHDPTRPPRGPWGKPDRSALGLDRCLSVHLRPPPALHHRLGAVYRL